LNAHQQKLEAANRKFVQRLKKKPGLDIDDEVMELHERAFTNIDCLSCANCCKTISPVFKDRDIVRLAAHFRIRPAVFTEKYLYLDEEGDYVLKSTPCPFLAADNKCTVYDQRPGACRSYPHTATLKFSKSSSLFIKNSVVCPAVYEITEELKRKYG
jgi:uncharacterized protein